MAFGGARRSCALLVMVVAVAVVGQLAGADFAADRAECADKLMGIATCLTYVQATATARAPTPDCCSGFKQVLGTSKKCLCVLVKDRDEPALGLKVNITRAMNLPSACAIAATFSDCPKILNMAPDSKEAEIFKQYGIEHEGKNATGAATPAASGAATGTTGGKSADAKSGAGRQRRANTVVFAVVSALLVSVFILGS
ncbi:non-specific lipid transfer protein GPI-anchored 14 [Lolium perenne]|uniref:non-specific lipid transfer protein GPI-anchored 14 n=1 Tax=Lolium perenne TaxID=4522 RepID=UPI0021EA1F6F|nr:non-specific lipid transfer protein GPI-anchored 13-like [Lolium perenne]